MFAALGRFRLIWHIPVYARMDLALAQNGRVSAGARDIWGSWSWYGQQRMLGRGTIFVRIWPGKVQLELVCSRMCVYDGTCGGCGVSEAWRLYRAVVVAGFGAEVECNLPARKTIQRRYERAAS